MTKNGKRNGKSNGNGAPAGKHRTLKAPLVVIGGSAGGIEALRQILPHLPRSFEAPILVVLHIAASSPGLLAQVLSRKSALPVQEARDGELIRPGRVYVAQPDLHLTVDRDRIRLPLGPKENRHRPSIDTLFRSAAWRYDGRVIGVLLTGNLNDGTAGLWAIKNSGGIAIVQDPAEADYPEMPANAVSEVKVDHVVCLRDIAPVLQTVLANQTNGAAKKRKKKAMNLETEISEAKTPIESTSELGPPSCFTCPECNGTLFKVQEASLLRFRCHTGHSFTAESLENGLSDEIESALWFALRALGEKSMLLRQLADKAREKNHDLSLTLFEDKAKAVDQAACVLKEMLTARNGRSSRKPRSRRRRITKKENAQP